MDKISFNIKKSSGMSPSINTKGAVQGRLRNPDKVYVKELFFSTHYEFPAIGESDKLYIATDENAQYRYDELDHAYHCVGRDPEDIDTIQIRLKEDI